MSSTHLYLLNKNALRILSISNYSSNNNNNDQVEENINNNKKNKTSSFPLTRDPSCWWNFLSCSCPRGSDDEQHDENFVNSSSSSTVVVSHLERDQYCIILKSIELPSCLHEEKLEILESILNNTFNTNNFSSSAVTTTSMKMSTLTSLNNNNTPSKVTDHEVIAPKNNNNILCLPSSNNKKMKFVFVRSVFSSTTGKKNEKNSGFVMGWIPEIVLSRQSFTLEHLTTKKLHTTIVSNGSFPSFSSSPTSTAEIYFSSLLSSSSSSLSKHNSNNFEYKKLMFGATTTKTKQPQHQDQSLLSSSHHHHSYANTLFKYKLVKHNGKNYHQQRASPNSFYINNFNASSNFSLKSGGGASPSPPQSPASPPPVHNLSSSSSPYSPPSAGGASPNQNVANANNGSIIVPPSIRSSSPNSNNNNSSNETVLEVFHISVSEAKNPPPFLGAAPISLLSQQPQRHHHPSSSSTALLQQLPLSCQTDLRHLIMFAENDATHTSTFSARLGEGGSGFVLMGAVRRKTNKIIIVAPQQQEQGQEDPNEITSTALDELHQRLELDKNKDETSTTSSHHHLVAVKFIPLSLFGSSSSITSVSASSSFNTKFEHLRREIIAHALTSSHPNFVKLFGVYPVYSSVSAPVLTPQMVLDNNSPEFLFSLPPFVGVSKNQNSNARMNTACGKIIGVSLVFPFCDGGSLESLISSQALAFGGVFKNNPPSSSATPSYSSPNGKMTVGTKSSPLVLRSGNNNDNETSSSSPTLLIRGSPPPPLQKSSSSHLAQASSSSTVKKNTALKTSSRQRSTSSSATNNNSPNRMLQYNTNSSSTMPSLNNSPSKKSGLQQNNAMTNVYRQSGTSPLAYDQEQHQQYFSFPLAPLREFEIASILYAVVCGLNFLHNTLGIAHRDMKPGNILLNSKGEILIADLGIAKQVCSENHYIRRCDLVLKKHLDFEGDDHENKSPFNSSSGDINHNQNTANDNPFDTLIGPPSAPSENNNNSNSNNITLENSIGFPSQQQHHNSSAPQVQRSITPPPNLGGGMTFCGTAFFIAPEVFQQMFPKLETHQKKESSTNTADHNNKNNESTIMMIDLRKADIFSLGVVMRMLLFPVEVLASGNVPEGVLNNPQFCNGSSSEEEDPKSSFSSLIHPSITRDCKKLITNLLLSNPNERFTCDQILNSDFIKKIFSSTENSSCYHLSPSMANLVLLRNQIIFDGDTNYYSEISNQQQQQISSASSEATKFYQQLLQKEEVEIEAQEKKIQKLQEQKAILPIIVPSPSSQQQQQANHQHLPLLATTTTTTYTKSHQQPKIIITPRTSSPKQNDNNNSDSAGDFGVPLLNFVNAATAKKRTSTTSTPRNETSSGTQQQQQDQQEEENNVVVTFRSASVDSKNQQHHHVVPSSSSVSSNKN